MRRVLLIALLAPSLIGALSCARECATKTWHGIELVCEDGGRVIAMTLSPWSQRALRERRRDSVFRGVAMRTAPAMTLFGVGGGRRPDKIHQFLASTSDTDSALFDGSQPCFTLDGEWLVFRGATSRNFSTLMRRAAPRTSEAAWGASDSIARIEHDAVGIAWKPVPFGESSVAFRAASGGIEVLDCSSGGRLALSLPELAPLAQIPGTSLLVCMNVESLREWVVIDAAEGRVVRTLPGVKGRWAVVVENGAAAVTCVPAPTWFAWESWNLVRVDLESGKQCVVRRRCFIGDAVQADPADLQ